MEKRKDHKGRVLKDGEYQRTDGRYEYRYKDSFSGRQISVYSWRLNETDGVPEGKKRKKSLRELEKEIRENEAFGIDTRAANRTTVDDLFRVYSGIKSDLRETTRAMYQGIYERHIQGVIGQCPVGSIRYSQIKSLYLSLIREKGLSPASLVPINAVLHSMFELAVRDGLVRTNPANGILGELKRHSKTERTMKSLTPEQQERFLDFVMAEKSCKKWHSMLTVLFGTGLRVGELCGLTWSDIDFKRNVIHICRSLGFGKRLGSTCDYFINPPKTEASRREIPMIQSVRDALRQEYAACLRTGFCPAEVDGISGFVFWTRNGNPCRKGNVDYALSRMATLYNQNETERACAERREPVTVPLFSAHDIRHTVASRLVGVEPNVKAVQEILGHANARTTLDIYAEAMPEDKAATMSKFESRFLTGS